MSRALTSDKAGYFLNVLLNTDCNPLSSLKDVADDIQEIKEDFIENLEQIEEDQDDLKEKFNENLEDLRAEADEKRQMVEEKIRNVIANKNTNVFITVICAYIYLLASARL